MRIEEPCDRLKAARAQAGFKSASEAARRLGRKVVTYTAHENGGREFDRKDALDYGNSFGVDPAWLLFGDRDTKPQRVALRSVKTLPQRVTTFHKPESPAVPLAAGEEHFEMPDTFFESRLIIAENRARILEVRGDSMYDPENPSTPGSMYPGERVVFDLDDTRPTPPGAFVIHDGSGPVIKFVETVPYSTPLRLRLSNRNPRYAVHEVAAEQVQILGRVKAKVSMLV